MRQVASRERLLFFRAVVDQWAAVGPNHITKKFLGRDCPQSRVVVQLADDFSTQQPEIVHVPAIHVDMDDFAHESSGDVP